MSIIHIADIHDVNYGYPQKAGIVVLHDSFVAINKSNCGYLQLNCGFPQFVRIADYGSLQRGLDVGPTLASRPI